jgi:secernin
MTVMCDTLFVPSIRAPSGPAFFAKNSDRHPDEPQVMTLAKGPHWPSLLSRPVWMRGAEIGINARGVVIGNEAVFPRSKPARDGVLGMDILRLALEESATAEQAVGFISNFVETHVQGGNGAYRGKLFYDNSYLVADFTDAWIIETAGHRWAARRLSGPASISNCYTIEKDFDRSDPVTAAEKKGGYSFKSQVESRLYRFITQGDFRRACSLSQAGTAGAGAETMMKALRSHGPRVRGAKSVCMHGGLLVTSATTASMVVELRAAEHRAVIWFTASPMPCVSLFRPAVLEDGAFRPLWEDYDYTEGSAAAEQYWKQRRSATRELERTSLTDASLAARRDSAQQELIRLTAASAGAAEIGKVVRAYEGA